MSTLPRGIRNNNPGNIRWGADWQGLIDKPLRTDPAFCQFRTPEYGLRAVAKILLNYRNKSGMPGVGNTGIDSVREVISRWAPPNENDTEAYIKAVSKAIKKPANDSIDLTNRLILLEIIQAIVHHENGQQPYSDRQILDGIDKALVRKLDNNASDALRVISFHLSEFDLGNFDHNKPVQIMRTGTFSDPRYGNFEITTAMLDEMVRNFAQNAYGQKIFLDVAHKPENGGAGEFTRIYRDGNVLLGIVSWTKYGLESLAKKYVYLSAEYHPAFQDNENGKRYGCVLQGAALTLRPVIKRLAPVMLSEAAGAVSPQLMSNLARLAEGKMKNYLEQLRKRLEALKLNEQQINAIVNTAELAMKNVGEDDSALAQLSEQFYNMGVSIAPSPAAAPTNAPAAGFSQEQLRAEVSRQLAEQQQQQQQNALKLSELRTQLQALLDADASFNGLAADQRMELAEPALAVVTLGMSTQQLAQLAQIPLKAAQQLSCAGQLSNMGFPVISGSTRIPSVQVVNEQASLKLQEHYNQALRQTDSAANRRLRLLDEKELPPFAKRVLAQFDSLNARSLSEELRMLAGTTGMANTSLPAGYQRTVIREALSDLRILELVQTLTDPMAQATTEIPYEYRDVTQVVNGGVVYEGQGIKPAGVVQAMDTAYIVPMKISMKVSNEVMHFSSASGINWDAWGRNLESNSRYIRELICQRLANEMQRAADAYQAIDVSNESIAAQLNGSRSRIKLTNWPLVNPKQIRDLKGNPIGTVSNAITLVVNSVTIQPYDGTGTQSAGTYYVIESLNQGYIQLCNQLGVAVTPTASTTCTISYSYATNVSKFDMKLSTTKEIHLNGLIQKFGARKAILLGKRFVTPTFALMSPTLNDEATNAEQFAAEGRRDGSSTNSSGDLATIKGVPCFSTNAPGIHLGDERIIIGQRGTMTYTVAKPYTIVQPFEAINSSGLPTGEKIAYGEEYNAMHVPSPIRGYMTSIVVYNSDDRAAA